MDLLRLVEYCGTGRSRAKQLNEVLHWIDQSTKDQMLDPNQVWVAVYDADSRPHPKTFDYFLWKIQKNKELKAFQQTIDYRLNEKSLIKNPTLWANSIHHTARCYLSEIPLFLNSNARIQKGKKSNYPPYYMGHGEFIRLDLLKQVGGFPNEGFCDGIQLGFVVTLCDQATEIIPYPDFCESPASLSSMIEQHSMWFTGLLSVFSHILRNKKGSLLALRQCLFYLGQSTIWFICPLFFFTLFLACFHQFLGNPFAIISFILISGSILAYIRLIGRVS